MIWPIRWNRRDYLSLHLCRMRFAARTFRKKKLSRYARQRLHNKFTCYARQRLQRGVRHVARSRKTKQRRQRTRRFRKMRGGAYPTDLGQSIPKGERVVDSGTKQVDDAAETVQEVSSY